MKTALYWGSDEERAKRHKKAKGVNTNLTLDTAQRWASRQRADEQLAREMGLPLRYDDVRSHNTSLYRQGGLG